MPDIFNIFQDPAQKSFIKAYVELINVVCSKFQIMISQILFHAIQSFFLNNQKAGTCCPWLLAVLSIYPACSYLGNFALNILSEWNYLPSQTYIQFGLSLCSGLKCPLESHSLTTFKQSFPSLTLITSLCLLFLKIFIYNIYNYQKVNIYFTLLYCLSPHSPIDYKVHAGRVLVCGDHCHISKAQENTWQVLGTQ